MRWIFLTLVFGNLLLLVYFWQQQNREAVTPVAALELSGGARQLQLTSELAQPLPPLKRKQASTSARAELCYAGGPFSDEIDARHLQARAAALGFSGRIDILEVAGDEPADYWVYVPPRASREEALRTLRELQQRKYDSYIITQGDLAEGVSLGLFRNKESAYRLQKTVAAYGIPVDVRVVNKTAREYWVEIAETAQLSEAIRERIRGGEEAVRWELVQCNRGS